MITGYFSSAKDKAIIQSGGFFCKGCLIGKPAVELSPEPAYCLGCHDFLKNEKNCGQKTDKTGVGVSDGDLEGNKRAKVVGDVALEFCHSLARGRKPKSLPTERIYGLAGKGCSVRVISATLEGEGVKVSYRTIARVLKQGGDSVKIKLRAERRAGEMLKETELNGGIKMAGKDNIGGYIVQPPKELPTLNDLGISKIQSHRWQLEAAIPEEKVNEGLKMGLTNIYLTETHSLRLGNYLTETYPFGYVKRL